MRRLSDAKLFETVYVENVKGSLDLKCRIMELGITKGVKILIKKFAPMGGPMQVMVRGYNLCLGKSEAKNVLIV